MATDLEKAFGRGYNEGKKDGKKETIKRFEDLINRILDFSFTKPIKKRLIEEVDKLKDGKSAQEKTT